MRVDLLHFHLGQDGGQAFVLVGAHGIDWAVEFDFEHMAIEKEQGAERLILRGGGYVLLDG